MSPESERSLNFIEARVEADLAAGTYGGRVVTRFPPEPNGYLHIGHAKSICLNFGLAQQYGGSTHLRFDDTNPEKEDPEYVEAIQRDIRWLGFEPAEVFYASDYYDTLYAWAELLVERGMAYVDDSSVEEMRAMRGTVTEAGTASAGRSRSPEENLALFRRMKAGEFKDGAMVLRAKIGLGHANMKMRDPLMYRIRHAHHFRTGDTWCIYPMYDWAHGQSDAMERITHSICTLEFENNRELYEWFLQAVGAETVGTAQFPQQIEFARLFLNYTVMSKRRLLRLVQEKRVDGWDDPRMPTISALRRRGVRPEAIREFAQRVGMARANSIVDMGVLEHAIRDDLNHVAVRRMAVLDPLPVEITNFEGVEQLTGADFPSDVGLPGERSMPLRSSILIERADFAVEPPKGFKRLVPGGEVRLRYGYVLRCDEVIEQDGEVVGLKASIDRDTLGRNPDRKIGGTIHWVSAEDAVKVEARLYDRLFKHEAPDSAEDFMQELNADSLTVVTAHAEPAVGELAPGATVQFERQGYFFRDPTVDGVVFNRTVTLKDGWTKKKAMPVGRAAPKGPSGAVAAAANAAAREEKVAAFLERNPDQQAAFDALVGAGARASEVLAVLDNPLLRPLVVEPSGDVATLVSWTCQIVGAAAKERDSIALDASGLHELLALVKDGTISKQIAKELTPELVENGGSPKALVESRGLAQVSDSDAIGQQIEAVLAGLPDEVARFRAGEKKLMGFLIGAVMRATGGKANAGVVRAELAKHLG